MPIIYGKYDSSLGKPPVDEMIEQAEALIKKKSLREIEIWEVYKKS